MATIRSTFRRSTQLRLTNANHFGPDQYFCDPVPRATDFIKSKKLPAQPHNSIQNGRIPLLLQPALSWTALVCALYRLMPDVSQVVFLWPELFPVAKDVKSLPFSEVMGSSSSRAVLAVASEQATLLKRALAIRCATMPEHIFFLYFKTNPEIV